MIDKCFIKNKHEYVIVLKQNINIKMYCYLSYFEVKR